GLAAAVVILFVGWWAISGLLDSGAPPIAQKHPEGDPLLAGLMEQDLRLAEAKTPSERVERLAAVADELQYHTKQLAREAESGQLQDLAQSFERVIQDGVLRGAKDVAIPEQARVLIPIADRLKTAGLDAEDLARKVP